MTTDATTDVTVTGEDWSGRDLAAGAFTRVAFVDVDLTETRSDGATFTECTFRRAQLNVSVHANAAFVNCRFVGCAFFDARFTDCKLVGSTFERCTFDSLQVGARHRDERPVAADDLRTASFVGVRMREADLTGARCQGATLRHVDLSGAALQGAQLSRCDLRGSDLSAVEPEQVALRGAIVTYEQALAIAAALGLDIRAE